MFFAADCVTILTPVARYRDPSGANGPASHFSVLSGILSEIRKNGITAALAAPCGAALLFMLMLLGGIVLMAPGWMAWRRPHLHASIAELSRYGRPLEVLADIDHEISDASSALCLGPPDKRVSPFCFHELDMTGHLVGAPLRLIYLELEANGFSGIRREDLAALERAPGGGRKQPP